MTVQLFPDIDLNPTTKMPNSPFPSWYFTEKIDELKESIRQSRAAIENGWIAEMRLPQSRAELARKEDMLSKMLDSIPKVGKMDMEKLASLYVESSDLLKPSYFSRSDMKKGIADAHEEVSRMLDPCIDVRGDLYLLAKSFGCQIVEGKIAREELARVWKILGKFLGKPTNTEILRKD